MKIRINYLTQTGLMLALIIIVQLLTRSFPHYVTGALVNLVLLIATLVLGLSSGLTVALISPFLAFIIGIGPAFIQILFFVALANAIFVAVAASTVKTPINQGGLKARLSTAAGLILAALLKMSFLWLALVKFALPLIPGLKEPQIKVISAAFTWPQLVTALLGGALAMIIVPLINRAKKK